MFETLKIYKGREINLESTYETLVQFGYKRVNAVTEEGDFGVRGENIFIFPATLEYPIRVELSNNKVEGIKTIDPISYKTIAEHEICIILPLRDMLRKRIHRARTPRKGESDPIDSFVDIAPSDYVVHLDYGIGRYLGTERVKVKGEFIDHMVIEYKDGGKLYVPFSDLDKVQKYIAFDRRPPKLYRIGSSLWRETKEKARKSAAKVALEILEIQAKRNTIKGVTYSPDTDWQRILEKSFPFAETKDQLKTTDDVKKDMQKPRPMDRLICGDVGYGKTEVALRAAFKAVMDNKQVAILVPTTILAEQHYTTFRHRMKEFPVNIDMLSRFKTGAEQDSIIASLKSGAIDIIIGTHRLLSGDIRFKDLGLVIIDEEQRFGVRHKEALKKLRLVVDILTLTATPIPRTLYLALMGGRDISIIDTPPLERLPVKTHIIEFDDKIISKAIAFETGRKGQVYFVNNLIYGMGKLHRRLEKLFPALRIKIAHGRMGERELEKTMADFIKGNVDVLLSTTIIESGIDIPNANTIIINNADKFGLADLYQLRGRVGRFTRRAFCYLMVDNMRTLTGDIQKRLFTIKKYQELGSGFKIAMQDLQIRGAGNILGTEQHGFINSVGFDFYCRLLRSSIESIKTKMQ